jgi:hypothetical protein
VNRIDPLVRNLLTEIVQKMATVVEQGRRDERRLLAMLAGQEGRLQGVFELGHLFTVTAVAKLPVSFEEFVNDLSIHS